MLRKGWSDAARIAANTPESRKKRADSLRINLIGKRFGKWTVLNLSKSGRHTFWSCRCDCGNEKEVRADVLRTGLSQSCGLGHCNFGYKEVCLRGHKISEWGRGKEGSCKACLREKRLENREYHRDYGRKYNLRTKYNMTVEDYEKVFLAQNGRCAICGVQPKKSLVVDHNHKTGRVRGLLCPGRPRGCNYILGLLERNSSALSVAGKFAEYVSSEGCWPWIAPDKKKKRKYEHRRSTVTPPASKDAPGGPAGAGANVVQRLRRKSA